MGTKLLFSVFNTALRSYSSKLVTVNRCRIVHNYINNINCVRCPSSIDKGVQYCTNQGDIATYEEIEDISSNKHKGVLLIDVREPEELVQTGVLPGSINIPLGDIERVLRDTSNEKFLKIYGKDKPNVDTPIIFSCMLGKRSATAQAISQQLGYKNVKNYLGGWLDWEERLKKKAVVFRLNVNFSDTEEPLMDKKNPILSFEDVNRVKRDAKYLLIDVREPSELLETGSIPGSINISLDDLENVLTNLSANEFKEKYHRDKPGKESILIFSCRSGRRSAMAREKAITLGYQNVYDYSGSWLDWEEHTKGKN